MTLNLDPRLPAILAMPLDEAEAIRKREQQEAHDRLEQLMRQQANLQPLTAAWHDLQRDIRDATNMARACRNRNAWLWHLGHRW